MSTADLQHPEEVAVETELGGSAAPYIPSDSVAPLFTNPADWFVPPFPEKLEDLDVNPGFLADLALKTVPLESDCTTATIAAHMHLGMMITEALLQRLARSSASLTRTTICLSPTRPTIMIAAGSASVPRSSWSAES
jgi:hypothetical protein